MFAQRFLATRQTLQLDGERLFRRRKKSILARDHGFLLLFCKMGVGNIDTGEMQGFV